ncbi:hypothetical protein HRbin17_02172 [bacterium HR17]|jgi:hypothetical protein|uniref:Cytochrome c-552/4 domain-containing protein n=1 Tax=Candidatus Fervidibacter japonicus TaxID=2035412 RepID=A0A2H5XEN2_9BACT|nr:hypothetical protein HRbin17_02172 [bacterium HR17]
MGRLKGSPRWSVVTGIGLALALTVATAFVHQEPTPPSRLPRLRGRCQVCHRTEALEWVQSAHAKAWTSDAFVAATANRTRKECLHCHAPDRILVTGFGKEPSLRNELPEHGVDCVACHEDANGAHHGTLGTVTDKHPTVKNERFGTVEQCATCHAKFGTVQEFKGTKWGSDPKSCVTCHMPATQRPIALDSPERPAHVHTFKGADPEMFRRGVKVETDLSGDRLTVRLTSVEVGHNFPTGIDTVVAVVDVRLVSGGQEVLRHQTVLADERAQGGNDTRLKPGETREIVIPLEGKKGEAVVRILHKPLRDLPDEKATVLFETKVAVP